MSSKQETMLVSDLGAPGPVRLKTTAPRLHGLVRPRLVDLPQRWRRLLVLAPAGAGKSTLLSQIASRWQATVSWVNLDECDSDPDELARSVREATDSRLDLVAGRWQFQRGEPLLLVFDDAHKLADHPQGCGTPSAAASHLAGLARTLPRRWRLIIAGRAGEGLGLTSLQVAPDCLTLTWDDLRFRTWEIDELFAKHYRQPLLVTELPSLARSTEGWAAALHLFHLASLQTPSRRVQLMNEIRAQSVVLRHYLTEQVLAALQPEELALASEIAVFEHIQTGLVLDLVGGQGIRLVDRLQQLGLLTITGIPDEFHLHSLLRDHLLEQFVTSAGHAGLLDLYRRAGAVLERHGLVDEAARSYLRAGNLVEARRLDGKGFDSLDSVTLPRGLGNDPWSLWAKARIDLRRGSLVSASRLLQQSRQQFPTPPSELVELTDDLTAWLGPTPLAEPADPWGALRRWLDGNATAATILATSTGPPNAIYRLLSSALDGDWEVCITYRSTDRLCQILLRLIEAFARLIAGVGGVATPLREAELLLQTGLECSALERVYLGLSVPATTVDSETSVESVFNRLRGLAQRDGDDTAVEVLNVIEAAHRRATDMRELLCNAGMHRLTPLIEATRSRGPDVDDRPGQDYFIILTGTFRIGGFSETAADQPLRPQQVAILQILALHAAQWLDREQLIRWFWPDVNRDAALRRLATALSAIRRALETSAPPATIERQGSRYRLDPGGGTSDLAGITTRLRSAEIELASNLDRGLHQIEECLALQQGPLLPSAESAPWLDEARWELEARWERAAHALFEAARSQPPTQVLNVLPGLVRHVSHSDNVWRGAIELADAAGSPLLAKQLRKRYERLLED